MKNIFRFLVNLLNIGETELSYHYDGDESDRSFYCTNCEFKFKDIKEAEKHEKG